MISAPAIGFVKLHRKLLNWEWIGDPNVVAVFVQILLRVNREPKRWKGIDIPIGSFFTSRATLAASCGLTEKQVRRALDVLELGRSIERKRAGSGLLLSLVKWEEYQEKEPKQGRQRADNRAEVGPDEGHSQGRQRATTEEVEKERSKEVEKEESSPEGEPADRRDPSVQAVVDFFEAQLGGKCDGPQKQNRWHAASLLKRMAAEFPEHDAVVSVKALIQAAREDEFHRRNATSFTYLLKHSKAIVEARKARAANPKTQTNAERNLNLAATLERQRIEREQASSRNTPTSATVPQS